MEFKWFKIRENATPPFKKHNEDSGWDLTAHELVKVRGNVEFWGTGIGVIPPPNHYFLLFARSSLPSLGYSLANGVGVIDQGYRGEIVVPLLKINKYADSMIKGTRIAQIVLMPFKNAKSVEISKDSIDDTYRNDGGFGSTGR